MKAASLAIGFLSGALLISCSPDRDEMRSVVSEMMRERNAVQYFGDGTTLGPYTPGVRAGQFLFLSGQIGMDPATGKLAGTDITSQTRQALRNIENLLARADLDSSSVVQCTVYLKDIRDYKDMNLTYGGYFGDGMYPARTTVEVSALPAGALVEIAAIAYSAEGN